MTVVVDSSIIIAFALSDEPLHHHAQKLFKSWQVSETTLTAPSLFRFEITAVIRKAVYQKRLDIQEGRTLIPRILAYPIEYIDDDALLQSAYELATQFNRPRTYDAQYLALAQRLDCEFWTADATLVNAIHVHFPQIRWLGDFKQPE